MVIWKKFGNDLSENRENRLIISPLRRIENFKTNKGDMKLRSNSCKKIEVKNRKNLTWNALQSIMCLQELMLTISKKVEVKTFEK